VNAFLVKNQTSAKEEKITLEAINTLGLRDNACSTWNSGLRGISCVRKKEGSAGFETALSGLEVEDLTNYTIAASIPMCLISTAYII
jgi:hypothetical protein